jgi:hypothetical protein
MLLPCGLCGQNGSTTKAPSSGPSKEVQASPPVVTRPVCEPGHGHGSGLVGHGNRAIGSVLPTKSRGMYKAYFSQVVLQRRSGLRVSLAESLSYSCELQASSSSFHCSITTDNSSSVLGWTFGLGAKELKHSASVFKEHPLALWVSRRGRRNGRRSADVGCGPSHRCQPDD